MGLVYHQPDIEICTVTKVQIAADHAPAFWRGQSSGSWQILGILGLDLMAPHGAMAMETRGRALRQRGSVLLAMFLKPRAME